MIRFAVLFTAAALLSAPAFAGTYSAKPVTAPAARHIIGRDISWACGPDACQGSTDQSRPIILCQDLAKRAGRLESFIANGRALSTTDLDKCNSAVRDAAPAALATTN